MMKTSMWSTATMCFHNLKTATVTKIKAKTTGLWHFIESYKGILALRLFLVAGYQLLDGDLAVLHLHSDLRLVFEGKDQRSHSPSVGAVEQP